MLAEIISKSDQLLNEIVKIAFMFERSSLISGNGGNGRYCLQFRNRQNALRTCMIIYIDHWLNQWMRLLFDISATHFLISFDYLRSAMILSAARTVRHDLLSYIPLFRTCSTFNVSRKPLVSKAIEDFIRLNWDDSVKPDDPEVVRLADGILSGSRSALAEGITLLQARHSCKRAQGNFVLGKVLKAERDRFKTKGVESLIFRIGISGSPGVGKSSFIEAFGQELANNQRKKVAVLTVDPSSVNTGGSLLGDLTRMQNLSRNPNAFIRQSPSNGSLGGVTRGVHEAIILCESAGYNVVIIETVGVGQSEIGASDLSDLFCLLLSPAHGDELQGVKRGIVEQSDLFIVTKADGELENRANATKAEYTSALKFMRTKSEAWKPPVLTASVYKPETIVAVWKKMLEFWEVSSKEGLIMARRNEQYASWMWNHVQDEIMTVFKRHPEIKHKAQKLEHDVRMGITTPGFAAEKLLRSFFGI